MEKLTTEAIGLIRKERELHDELIRVWKINRVTLWRWLQRPDNHKLTHPRTLKLIGRYNKEKFRLVQ